MKKFHEVPLPWKNQISNVAWAIRSRIRENERAQELAEFIRIQDGEDHIKWERSLEYSATQVRIKFHSWKRQHLHEDDLQGFLNSVRLKLGLPRGDYIFTKYAESWSF